MTINSTFAWRGHVLKVKYYDLDSFDSLPYDKCQQVYGVCFYENKMVIVLGEGVGGVRGVDRYSCSFDYFESILG